MDQITEIAPYVRIYLWVSNQYLVLYSSVESLSLSSSFRAITSVPYTHTLIPIRYVCVFECGCKCVCVCISILHMFHLDYRHTHSQELCFCVCVFECVVFVNVYEYVLCISILYPIYILTINPMRYVSVFV